MISLKTISIFFLIFLSSFQNPDLPKRIYDKEFKYEFYTIIKKINPSKNKKYYWFKGGKIHNSEFGATNELLNGKYIKFYLTNQLAEQGVFKNGLKKGVWKKWFENGTLSKIENYNNGHLSGKYEEFDNNGKLIVSGNYRNNKKHGYFIYHQKKDTVRFKNDSVFIKEIKEKKIKSKDVNPKKNKSKEVKSQKQPKENKKNVKDKKAGVFSKKEINND